MYSYDFRIQGSHKLDYVRRTHTPDPMSRWGHAMFAEDESKVMSYGNYRWTIKPGVRLVDIQRLRRSVEEAVEEFGPPDGYDDADDILSSANPSDIVNTAGLWDDAEGFQWMWTNVLEPKGISGLELRNGAIVFDPDWIVPITDEDSS